MQRRNVVLPEPEAPMMQTVSPFLTVEGDTLQHLEAAEALVHVFGEHDVAVLASPRAPRPGAHGRPGLEDTLPEGELVTALAGGQPPLDLRLDHAPDARQHEIPESDRDESTRPA